MTSTLPKIDPQGHYSIKECALILGYSIRQIQRYISDNRIKSKLHKITNKRFVIGAEIIKFFNNYI